MTLDAVAGDEYKRTVKIHKHTAFIGSEVMPFSRERHCVSRFISDRRSCALVCCSGLLDRRPVGESPTFFYDLHVDSLVFDAIQETTIVV